MSNFLSEEGAAEVAGAYLQQGGRASFTQEILDSGAIPRLKGYTVRPGKVSDSIFGGTGNYHDKKTGRIVEFENPPLQTRERVDLRIMVRTQRISTHDITRGEIPFKDQILAMNHQAMRTLVGDILGTSQYDVEGLADTAVVIAAENLRQIPFENVLRAYMAKSTTSTSLYQAYIQGEQFFGGHELPKRLIPNGPLPYVMDTPSTKSDEHDKTLDPEWLFEHGICKASAYTQIRNASLVAFGMVAQFLLEKGIMLVDTKTEHGTNHRGQIVSQDELYTMDSSRFWLLDDYTEQWKKLQRGEIVELNPKSYSKEFARGFSQGDQGYTPEQCVTIAARYIVGIQHLLGKRFAPDLRPRNERVVTGLQMVVEQLVVQLFMIWFVMDNAESTV